MFVSGLAKALILLFVFAVPWENMIIIPGVGTMAKLVGFAAGGVGIIDVLARNRIRLHPFLLAGLMFVAWAWASVLWSIDQESTIQRVLTYTQLWLMSFLIFQYNERSYLENLLLAYVLGAWIASLATVQGYILDMNADYMRYAAPGFNPNDLSIYLDLAVPFAAYLGFKGSDLPTKIFSLAYIPVALFVVLLTASRAGALGLGMAFLFVLYSFLNLDWKWRLIATFLLAVGLGLALTQVPLGNYAQIATIGAEITGGTLDYRTIIWAAGLKVFCDHPILGVGIGAFPLAVEPLLIQAYSPHNAFIGFTVEGGLIGLVLWVLLVALSFIGVRRLHSSERLLWLVILMILMIAFLSTNLEWGKASWLMMVLAASFSAIRPQGIKNPKVLLI